MVADLIDTSRVRLEAGGFTNAQEVRDAGAPVIAFSDGMWRDLREIRAFLFANMYRAPGVMEQRRRVTLAVNDLFPMYMADPSLLPGRWQPEIAAAADDTALARLVADYVAGMTDRFALQQHARLTGTDVLHDGS
jgi:dGTPase